MIAVAAGRAGFAKLREQGLRSAARRGAKPRHRPPAQEFGQRDRIVGERSGRPPAPRQFAPVEQQQCVRRKAVAAGAADLLIIALDQSGGSAWATKRTFALSTPMPKAMVATMTTPSRAKNAS